jgi:fumarylpyruvate hydrolase
MTEAKGYVVAPEIHVLPVVGTSEMFAVRRIYCVGRNYLDHIREMNEADERDPPFFFQKPTDALVQNGATLPYPADTDDFHYEIELVAALGQGGRNVPVERALDLVYGYGVGLDMTRRDRQRDARDRRLPWEMGKSFDGSAPCSPLVPATKIGHPSRGAITLHVNGVEKQRGDLSDLIWNVSEIISNLSNQYELKAGDLIFTGTPAGVGPVVPGDKMEGAIAGFAPLHITIAEPKA